MRRGHRVVALVVGVSLLSLSSWALAASASRAATSASAVAIAVYFLLRPKLRARALAVRLLVIGAISAVAVLLLTRFQLLPLTLQHRISRTLDPVERTSLVDDRVSLALAGLRAFLDSPLVGTGLDNFRYIAYRYVDGTSSQAPHNLWIQFLAQVGIVATVAFAWFNVFWFSSLLAAYRRAPSWDDQNLTWAFVASMSAIMAIAVTIPIVIERHYWLLLGLGLALSASLPTRSYARAVGSSDGCK